jgi:DnaJ-class molecular chaperone
MSKLPARGGGGPADDFFRDFFPNRGGGGVQTVVSFDIACTLDELYNGATKKIKVSFASF